MEALKERFVLITKTTRVDTITGLSRPVGGILSSCMKGCVSFSTKYAQCIGTNMRRIKKGICDKEMQELMNCVRVQQKAFR